MAIEYYKYSKYCKYYCDMCNLVKTLHGTLYVL
jgi:hypothetical protein